MRVHTNLGAATTAAHMTAGKLAAGKLAAGVCPAAPPGMQTFADQITAWVKWGVLALVVLAAVVSIGSILIGRIFSHPHASRYGAMGLAVTIMSAVLYVTVLVILASITGSGCS